MAKGVPTQNLVAIDRDVENVQRVRDKAVPILDGDVVDILWSWPEGHPVCAVLLDFCSGLEWANSGIYDAFERLPLRHAVAAINLMRGRDSFSNGSRQTLEELGLLKPIWSMRHDGRGEPELVHEDTKHRAFQFLLFHAFDLWVVGNGLGGSAVDASNPPPSSERRGVAEYLFPAEDDPYYQQSVAQVCTILMRMEPRFFSYKSGSLTFDSAVFQSLARRIPEGLEDPAAEARNAAWRLPDLTQRVIAMLAVRTRRLRQQ